MPSRLLLVGVLLAGAVAGCGEGAKTTAAVAQVPPVALTIDRPDGNTVPARVVEGAYVGDVSVEGQSQPGSLVRVTSDCTDPACDLSGQADDNGRWRVRLRASASAAQPYARITAELAGQSALGLVRLKPPSSTRGERKDGGRRPSRRPRKPGPETGGASPDPAPTPAPAPLPLPPAPTPPLPGSGATSSLLLVGDSLAVGTESRLRTLLEGWSVLTDARQDRRLDEGMARWRAQRGAGRTFAFSLFTNDDPSNLAALEAAVRESARAGCSVWATIARPPQRGVSYARANALLERLAAELPGRVVVVPWAAEVVRHPDWVGRDRVHATAAGYAGRAQMYAEAARSCV